MKLIIACIILSVIAVISIGTAIKFGGEVVEINDQFAKYKKDKEKEIKDLKDKHDKENEIQGDLANVLSVLTQLGFNVNGKLNEILKKPVYSIRCSDADGVREVNKYAGKKPSQFTKD